MLCNDIQYQMKVMENLYKVFHQDLLPSDHVNFLENVLHKKFNIQPKIIYDIGSAVLHWERHAKRIFKDASIYVFDAFSPLEELYKQQNVNYTMCCLSNVDGLSVPFYQNDMLFGGNSIFKERTEHFPPENYIIKKTRTLDSIVNEKNLPYPDMIKIDAQGNELNILKGATQVLKCCSYLILELPTIEYNEGAPQKDDVIEYLKNIGYIIFCEDFSVNIADADTCFVNTARTNFIINSLN